MYTLIFRKGAVELEFTTSDKSIIERQLSKIISQASNKVVHSQTSINEQTQGQKLNVKEFLPEVISTQAETTNETKEEHLEVNDVKPAFFENISEDEKKRIIENSSEDIIPQTIDIAPVKPLTINSLQNPEPEPTPDFDKILNTEMNYQTNDPPILKDEKFINYVEGKSALEKLDFLIITAQYLAQNEGMNTFNLKHINAKLMQNFTIIVDHSVLQSAISREFITRIQEGADETSSEYMLTEKGLRSY